MPPVSATITSEGKLMARKSKQRLAREDLVDLVRTIVRTQLKRQQRRILNDLENKALDEFDRRVQAGEPYELESDYSDWIESALRRELKA